ncbi:MAG: phage head-tail connector protein [Pseudomonadota bacterium]
MTLTVITPPDALPVPVSEMKDYLRIGHDGEDDLVSRLTSAATERIEAQLGQALVLRTLKRRFSAWPVGISGRGASLLPGPVSSLERVEIESEDADPDDVTGRFRLTCGRLALRPWSMAPPVPENGAATVQFQAGYGSPEAVPDDLKLAVKLLVAESYSAGNGCPEGSPLPGSVASILDTHRRVRL